MLRRLACFYLFFYFLFSPLGTVGPPCVTDSEICLVSKFYSTLPLLMNTGISCAGDVPMSLQ